MSGMIPRHFLGCGAELEPAKIVVFGAPFDGTVTFRPGARFAPARMREDSWGMETYSPYMDLDLEDLRVHDAGDLDLPFGDTVAVLSRIEAQVAKVLAAGKRPFMLGGEHLVTLPAISAFVKLPEYRDLCILHLDAHTDLREEYLGSALSHSTVMRQIWRLTGDGRIWQLGIRSGLREEFHWAGEGHTTLYRFDLNGMEAAVKAIGARPVYLTVDLDVLDPSLFSGTGTPEAGGVSFQQLAEALTLMRGLDIAGADAVELSPHYDPSGVSTAVACKVMREMLLVMGAEAV